MISWLNLGRLHSLTVVGLILGLILAATPARADWLRAESDHFVVYSQGRESELRNYVRKLERFDALLRLHFPVVDERVATPLTIYVVNGVGQMRQVWPEMGSSVAGFYAGSDDGVFALFDRRRNESDTTLFHEYAHHFMLANFPAAYPGWFVEGFAEYFMTADVTPGRIQVGGHSPGRIRALSQSNTWAPMEAVLASDPSPSQRGVFYSQAWLLTHYYFASDERRPLLGAYLAAVARGADPVEAAQETLGHTPAELLRVLRGYVAGAMPYRTLLVELPDAEVTIARMPRSADDMLLLSPRLRRLPEEEAERSALLADIRRQAARHPDDRLATLTLAYAETRLGDTAETRRLLQPLVEAPHDDALALLRLAQAIITEAEGLPADASEELRDDLMNEARGYLARSYQADPYDFRTYVAIAETRNGMPGYPNENDVETLRAAAALAPQVMSIRYRTAQVLMARGHHAEAMVHLGPVANNPHGGEMRDAALALLEEARAAVAASAAGEPHQEEAASPS